jgi:hypothetical protein
LFSGWFFRSPLKITFRAARTSAANPKAGDSPDHSFGAGLPDSEKANLIEYLKTL